MVNEEKLPPVSELAIVTMVLVVSAGITGLMQIAILVIMTRIATW